MLLNGNRSTHLLPVTAQIRSVRSLGGVDTEVVVESVDTGVYLHHRYHTGTGTFQYKRINLSALAGLSVQLQAPMSTHDVVLALSRLTGIVFDLNEIELDVCRSNVATLIARPNSLRWVGSVDITIDEPICYPLENLLRVNILRDLVYPVRKDLSDLLGVTILDDLRYPPIPDSLASILRNTVLDDLRYPGLMKSLSTLLNNNVLNDLRYPVTAETLAALLSSNILNDLTYPISPGHLAGLLKQNVLEELFMPPRLKPHISEVLRASVLTELRHADPCP